MNQLICNIGERSTDETPEIYLLNNEAFLVKKKKKKAGGSDKAGWEKWWDHSQWWDLREGKERKDRSPQEATDRIPRRWEYRQDAHDEWPKHTSLCVSLCIPCTPNSGMRNTLASTCRSIQHCSIVWKCQIHAPTPLSGKASLDRSRLWTSREVRGKTQMSKSNFKPELGCLRVVV